jgi:hypothetical protein
MRRFSLLALLIAVAAAAALFVSSTGQHAKIRNSTTQKLAPPLQRALQARHDRSERVKVIVNWKPWD